MNRIPLFALVFLGAVLSGSANGEIVSYTGKFKVQNDKCYNQINGDKGDRWEQFDCISFMEDALVNRELLSTHTAMLMGLENQHAAMENGRLTKEQYFEVVQRAIYWMSARPENREGVRQTMKLFLDEAAQILKAKKGN